MWFCGGVGGWGCLCLWKLKLNKENSWSLAYCAHQNGYSDFFAASVASELDAPVPGPSALTQYTKTLNMCGL